MRNIFSKTPHSGSTRPRTCAARVAVSKKCIGVDEGGPDGQEAPLGKDEFGQEKTCWYPHSKRRFAPWGLKQLRLPDQQQLRPQGGAASAGCEDATDQWIPRHRPPNVLDAHGLE